MPFVAGGESAPVSAMDVQRDDNTAAVLVANAQMAADDLAALQLKQLLRVDPGCR